ncbi:MAG: hypothetical protein JNK76_22505, partial [Planctomycetales bacterium]|nr:hypothetical protein [Planctomycetales bacterium]
MSGHEMSGRDESAGDATLFLRATQELSANGQVDVRVNSLDVGLGGVTAESIAV